MKHNPYFKKDEKKDVTGRKMDAFGGLTRHEAEMEKKFHQKNFINFMR